MCITKPKCLTLLLLSLGATTTTQAAQDNSINIDCKIVYPFTESTSLKQMKFSLQETGKQIIKKMYHDEELNSSKQEFEEKIDAYEQYNLQKHAILYIMPNSEKSEKFYIGRNQSLISVVNKHQNTFNKPRLILEPKKEIYSLKQSTMTVQYKKEKILFTFFESTDKIQKVQTYIEDTLFIKCNEQELNYVNQEGNLALAEPNDRLDNYNNQKLLLTIKGRDLTKMEKKAFKYDSIKTISTIYQIPDNSTQAVRIASDLNKYIFEKINQTYTLESQLDQANNKIYTLESQLDQAKEKAKKYDSINTISSIDQLPQNSEEPIKMRNCLINEINEKQNEINQLQRQANKQAQKYDNIQTISAINQLHVAPSEPIKMAESLIKEIQRYNNIETINHIYELPIPILGLASSPPKRIGNGLINEINEKQNEIDKLQNKVYNLQAPNPSLEPEQAKAYRKLLSDYEELEATKKSDKEGFQNQINQLQSQLVQAKEKEEKYDSINTISSIDQLPPKL
ncbi:MAG: hypothetical protein AAF380_03045 [Bacteroidota bacterium]